MRDQRPLAKQSQNEKSDCAELDLDSSKTMINGSQDSLIKTIFHRSRSTPNNKQ